jgi:hypothetical protein
MSSPQQPWSPGRPTPPGQPDGNASSNGAGSHVNGYGGPQPGAAPAQGHGQAPQGYGPAPQGYAPAQQAYGQAPGHGQPQGQPAPQAYGARGPTGELVINLRKPFGAMGMISPVVTIDGYPAGSTWGRNSFQVPAGVRQVDVAQTYLWTYGRASQPVNVEPGRATEIHYSGPMATFGFGGAIGAEPQKRPGTGLFVGLMVFVGVLLLLVVVLAVAFGGS